MGSGAPGQPVPPDEAVHRRRFRGPFWQNPEFDSPGAVGTMGTIAAPLLAGFSLSTFVLAFTLKARDTRYPNLRRCCCLLLSS